MLHLMLLTAVAASAPASPPRAQTLSVAQVQIVSGASLALAQVKPSTRIVAAKINTAKALVEYY